MKSIPRLYSDENNITLLGESIKKMKTLTELILDFPNDYTKNINTILTCVLTSEKEHNKKFKRCIITDLPMFVDSKVYNFQMQRLFPNSDIIISSYHEELIEKETQINNINAEFKLIYKYDRNKPNFRLLIDTWSRPNTVLFLGSNDGDRFGICKKQEFEYKESAKEEIEYRIVTKGFWLPSAAHKPDNDIPKTENDKFQSVELDHFSITDSYLLTFFNPQNESVLDLGDFKESIAKFNLMPYGKSYGSTFVCYKTRIVDCEIYQMVPKPK